MLILSINVVLACKYIGQSKKKCLNFQGQLHIDKIVKMYKEKEKYFFINV
jgi:hypothetical protein